jgi:hypothetical protein
MYLPDKKSISRQIAALSPEKKALLQKKLRKSSAGNKPELSIQPGKHKGPLPLSLSQHRLWLLEQNRRQSPVFNAYRAWRLKGKLDIEALRLAMNNIVKRHQVLRARFLVMDNEPFQVFDSDTACPLSVVNIMHLSPPQREDEAQALTVAEVKQPFTLEHGPVLRTLLLRMAEQDHIFLVNLDHLVVDGWSMGVLHRELGVLYEAATAGKPSPLAPLAFQYSDYCFWQRQRLKDTELQASLSYWKQQLAAAPVLQLPVDRLRPGQCTYTGARVTFELPEVLTRRLKRVSQEYRGTLFMTLLAMFKVLLRHLSGQHDFLVGTPVANRHPRELEPLVGLMVNHLPIRTDLGGNLTFVEVLACVREATLGAFSHQDVPFASIVDALDIIPDPGYHPLFQVFFTLQNSPDQSLTLPGLTVEPCLTGSVSPFSVGNDTAKFDMALSLVEVFGQLRGVIEYSTDLFDRSTITAIANKYTQGLQRIVDNPGQRMSDLVRSVD